MPRANIILMEQLGRGASVKDKSAILSKESLDSIATDVYNLSPKPDIFPFPRLTIYSSFLEEAHYIGERVREHLGAGTKVSVFSGAPSEASKRDEYVVNLDWFINNQRRSEACVSRK